MNHKVHTGADQLRELGPSLFNGMRIGLLTNPTGITSSYESTIDVCNGIATSELKALFACEHGIRGEKQAGVLFQDEVDERLGIPVYSLYGEHRKPTKEMLGNLDAILFDIQDLGVRFYTYLTTLVYAMDACAAHGKRLFVLDRPNPLGGLRSEGGLLEAGYESMVGAWRIPFTTGLTIGEFAQLVNHQRDIPCDLHVIPLKHWERTMEYPQTGLPWIMPSPNMPAMDTVRVYTGNCLFEGTNLSEGRGTTKPFEMIGAPWLDAEHICRSMNALGLPGVHYHPVTFTPMFSKHQGLLCHGVQTHVHDRQAFAAVSSALYLLNHIIGRHEDRFEWLMPSEAEQGKRKCFIDILSGSDLVRRTVHEPSGPEKILELWRGQREEWEAVRMAHLLYPYES